MKNIQELKQRYIDAQERGHCVEKLYVEKTTEMQKALNAIHDRFAADNAALIQSVSDTSVETLKAENALREALVTNYEITGVKTFDNDLSVRVTETITYPTEPALNWAKTNAPFLVQEVLDKKGFDSIAKARFFDFVEIERKVSAVVSKHLSDVD